MLIDYYVAPGEIIHKTDLTIPKAKEVVNALETLPFFRLLECKKITNEKESSQEVVVFETEPEISQKTVYDIKKVERIAVIFCADDNSYPEVLALRENFPKVPHLNIRLNEKPRSLCLFDEPYEEFRLKWTPMFFLKRIREWLALTARNELHLVDQPLEPLLSSSTLILILPFDLFSKKENSESFIVKRKGCVLVAERSADIKVISQNEAEFNAVLIYGAPQPHGLIYKTPKNLLELHNFLLKANIDLLSGLNKYLRNLIDKTPSEERKAINLILIIVLPTTRKEFSEPEAFNTWAFMLYDVPREIGVKTGGIWKVDRSAINAIARGVKIDVLNPIFSFSREQASQMSGLPQKENKKILLIGAGALGSQVFMNLIRMGFGEWTIVDKDCFLPHNLARHALLGNSIGEFKAESLSTIANDLTKGEPIAKAIVADVLQPFDLKKELDQSYKEAKIIIDASTSIPVARYLAQDVNSPTRRVSMFLNPSGTDVVILAEDEKRNFPLDYLEMQYYRFLINNPELKRHLHRSNKQIRYGRSCRDISNTIPQDLVALHAAICSQAIRNLITTKEAFLSIWKVNSDNMSVKNYKIPTSDVKHIKIGKWTLFADQWLLDKIFKAREKKLPKETGGVLIGAYDMQRKIIYAVDTILSPADSVEWPFAFERGCKGLSKNVENIKAVTAEQLNYIGEWHSHPGGYGTIPSSDDKTVFEWLKEKMSMDGLPPLLMIAGDNQTSWYIDHI